MFFYSKLIMLVARSLKHSQNCLMESLPLYTRCLFSMVLKEDIVGIEKPNGKCWLTFVVDEFSGLFLHPSVFSNMHSRSA